ncbi:hypothetical protein AAKU55_004923 [Oxalobacteraceae bacterium GrIS 1.11]
MSITQQHIADHLDLSQAEVSKFLRQLDLDLKVSSLDDVRVAYLRKLRAQAAGHRSDDGHDLVRERVMTERVDRELKIFTLAEKKGQLINVAQLEPELMQMVGAWRSELLGRDDKLKADLDALYGVDVDIQVLNDYTFAALNHLARYDASHRRDAGADSDVAGAAGTDLADGLVAQA